ncbi:hypothetical protein [Microbulbifer spongiae]|uniref:Uncharacterized protein n=1 Tax=Microbulbifer spongiae TaxID=2944933 RepID=A0ABY9EG68_9GAMM|nr:hypothetical protein [Microbulbifer sp. MI-G]WKD51046.1 hypothetical protein M8T91_06390 [Microbulbifer sp. MI-G]
MMVTPDLVPPPALPNLFDGDVIKSENQEQCPSIAGSYSISAVGYEVAEETGIIQEISVDDYDYVSIFGLGKKESKQFTVVRDSDPDVGVLKIIQSKNGSFELIVKHLTKPLIFIDSFVYDEDFSCKSGEMKFKVGEFKGGGDGTWFNYKTLISIRAMNNQGFLVYQQIAYPSGVDHNYYVFSPLSARASKN